MAHPLQRGVFKLIVTNAFIEGRGLENLAIISCHSAAIFFIILLEGEDVPQGNSK